MTIYEKKITEIALEYGKRIEPRNRQPNSETHIYVIYKRPLTWL